MHDNSNETKAVLQKNLNKLPVTLKWPWNYTILYRNYIILAAEQNMWFVASKLPYKDFT